MENQFERSWRIILQWQKFKQDTPLRCSCNEIFALGEKCGYLFGHAWVKGEDVKDELL